MTTQIQKYTNTEILRSTISLFQSLSHQISPSSPTATPHSNRQPDWTNKHMKIHKSTNAQIQKFETTLFALQIKWAPTVPRWASEMALPVANKCVFMYLETMVADLRRDNL